VERENKSKMEGEKDDEMVGSVDGAFGRLHAVVTLI